MTWNPPEILFPEPFRGESVRRVLSVSGGKDSTSTILAMRELGLVCDYVFADTGWEADVTYEYIAYLELNLGIHVQRVYAWDGDMRAKILHRAGFPSRLQRWCTRELKVEPLDAYHEQLARRHDCDIVSVVGIRADESPERADLPAHEFDPTRAGEGMYIARPLIRWTIEDVLQMHHRHGIGVNPLYEEGFDRVGCMPCINAAKPEIRNMARVFPERVDEIRGMERVCVDLRDTRNAEEPGRYSYEDATFFQSRVALSYEVVPGKKKKRPVLKVMYIDDVVAWSRTAHGGKKPLLVESPSGCTKWGLCEAPSRESLSPQSQNKDNDDHDQDESPAA